MASATSELMYSACMKRLLTRLREVLFQKMP